MSHTMVTKSHHRDKHLEISALYKWEQIVTELCDISPTIQASQTRLPAFASLPAAEIRCFSTI